MRIKYTTNELAYTKNGVIYLHPALKQRRWSRFRQELLQHELKHLEGGGLQDDLADIYTFMKKDTYLFCLSHPETFLSLMPDTEFDYMMIIVLAITLLVGWYLNPITLLQ